MVFARRNGGENEKVFLTIMFLVFVVSFSAFAACKNGRDGNNSETPLIGVTETEIYNIRAIMFGEPTKTEEKPEKTDSLPFNGEKITLNAERTSVKGEEIFGYDGKIAEFKIDGIIDDGAGYSYFFIGGVMFAE